MELRAENQVENSIGKCTGNSIGLSIAQKCSSDNEQDKNRSSISIYDDFGLAFKVLDKESGDGNQSIGTKGKDLSYGIKVAHGGTLNQIVKTGVKANHQVGGGIRESITRFSRASRNLLLRHLFSLDRTLLHSDEVLFITLTYDGDTDKNKWITGKEYKRHLKNITQAIQREYGGFGFWKFELQKRLCGHLHLVWFKTSYISHYWLSHRWNEITGGSPDHLKAGTQVERARSWKGVQMYASKVMGYLAKDDTTYAQRDHMSKIAMGRCWGISGREMFAEFVVMLYMELSERMHIVLQRCVKGLQKSWKRAIGNYKGWTSLKTWMRSWSRIDNLTLNLFMENSVIFRLLKWMESEFGELRFRMNVKKENKRDRKYDKLDLWRMLKGYGLYEGIV